MEHWCIMSLQYSIDPLLQQSSKLWKRLSPPDSQARELRAGSRDRTRMPYESIDVECYSGYRANERPVAFTLQDRRWQVEEILDRWYEGGLHPSEPPLDYFKVRTTEGRIFLLRYNSLFDAWAIRVPPKTVH
jgi:hypothetical protein